MKISKPMIIPTCYFQTTVFLIDDDVTYTKLLKKSLGSKFPIQVKNDPQTALDFFNEQYKQDSFWTRFVERKNSVSEKDSNQPRLNLSEISNLIYNKERFNQITVVICDYAMPGLTGAEFFKQVKTRDNVGSPVIKLILLTGMLDTPTEILNTLNAFYKKDAPLNELINKVRDFQTAYFEDASLGVAHYLANDPNNKTTCLTDEIFINHIKNHIKENNIVEYYMIDSQGSYIMLDSNAKPHWFFVRNEKGMENSIALAKKLGAPQTVIDAIQSKSKLLSLYEEDMLTKDNRIDWDNYLLPASILQGKNSYFYAVSEHFPLQHFANHDVLSYEAFLESQMR